MLEFSQIDKDLNIYKKHKVLLWGAGKRGGMTKRILEAFGVKVEGIVDSEPSKYNTNYLGIPISSIDEMISKVQGCNSYLVQVSCENEENIIKKLKQLGVKYISFAEFFCRTEQLGRYLLKKAKFVNLSSYQLVDKRVTNLILSEVYQCLSWDIMTDSSACNLFVSPPKTGNTSLRCSYDGIAISFGHSFAYIDSEIKEYLKNKEVNILCGVRDIIGQKLSLCFQNMESGFYWDMEEFWRDGGDVEQIFNKYIIQPIEGKCEYSVYLNKIGYDYGGPEFFEKHIKECLNINVYEYPFDKDTGYTIINKDNVHVFIYQLEKMDKLEKQISNFLGCGDDVKLQRDNEASNKWYHDSYKKAQKEIKFDREYFDECYEGKYMRHFYNDEDIERFKQKWIGNVRN